VLSVLRPGRTTITGVAHLRVKESDRLAALAAEIRKTSVEAKELADGLIIEGGSPRGAEIETYDDHRLAMSFAILGLAVPGMRIRDEGCVGKSFPGFWETLKGIY
jgi:3-phosphoshikimate 1-carboxyvinyltransferase